jgi:hypothetical protein
VASVVRRSRQTARWDPTDGFLMTRDDVLAPLEAKEKLEAAG